MIWGGPTRCWAPWRAIPAWSEVFRRLDERNQVQKGGPPPLMVVAGDHAKNDLAGGRAERRLAEPAVRRPRATRCPVS
ncbi:MAG: hypothetical protein ACLRWQ_20275 [Flavonifractor plautii]